MTFVHRFITHSTRDLQTQSNYFSRTAGSTWQWQIQCLYAASTASYAQ